VREGNPRLMRLGELEILEKVATSGKLNVVLGDKGGLRQDFPIGQNAGTVPGHRRRCAS